MHALIRFASRIAVVVMSLACVSAGQQVEIRTLISSGNLEELRWPNFSDYRNSIQEFYEPTGFSPAWVQASQPLPQALSLIELFRNAWRKGLDQEDYDASRWEQRIGALQRSAGVEAVAPFAAGLPVSPMRCLFAFRVGRLDPQHFHFGLGVD